MRAGRTALIVVVILVALVVVSCASAWRPSIAPIDPPPQSAFDAALVARGGELARLGDCESCHTAPGGQTYAGGRALQTPFGTLYGTNITPDPYTGIGRWSLEAFTRALRAGVDREGRHLYPAFPYDHFTLMSDDDIKALYAYLMTRRPVRIETPKNQLAFPFGFRPLLAGWNLLFLEQRRFEHDPGQSPEWNRGAYLAEGVAHCGACHTPRNALGAERKSQRYDGGVIEGWHAPAINASSLAPVPWTADALYAFLRTGTDTAHGVATGPMAPVVHNYALASAEDVKAIATYIASFTERVPAERTQKAQALLARAQSPQPAPPPGNDLGATIYASTCALCHGEPRDLAYSGAALDLALSTTVAEATPRNFVNIVLYGLRSEEGERGRWMPGYAGMLTDDQLRALAAYVRRQFARGQPWDKVVDAVKDARSHAASATEARKRENDTKEHG